MSAKLLPQYVRPNFYCNFVWTKPSFGRLKGPRMFYLLWEFLKQKKAENKDMGVEGTKEEEEIINYWVRDRDGGDKNIK